jgi:hypothetical protein
MPMQRPSKCGRGRQSQRTLSFSNAAILPPQTQTQTQTQELDAERIIVVSSSTLTPLVTSTPTPRDTDSLSSPERPSRDLESRKSILASERAKFEADLTKPPPGFRNYTRTSARIGSYRILWVIAHGFELEQQALGDVGPWRRYWLRGPCYFQDEIKLFQCLATTHYASHLRNEHGIGRQALQIAEDATQNMQSFSNEHLWEEKYRELFIHWVAKNDVTLLQASGPNLRALLLRSGPKVDRLLHQGSQ